MVTNHEPTSGTRKGVEFGEIEAGRVAEGEDRRGVAVEWNQIRLLAGYEQHPRLHRHRHRQTSRTEQPNSASAFARHLCPL